MGECSFIPRLTPFVEKFVFGQQYGEVETLGKGDIAVQNSVEGLNMDCLFSQFVNEWSSPLNSGPEILTELKKIITDASQTGDFLFTLQLKLDVQMLLILMNHLLMIKPEIIVPITRVAFKSF